jgi:predicted transcriptional regulator
MNASRKQIDFILSLASQLQGERVRFLTEVTAAGLSRRQKTGGMTTVEASQIIDELQRDLAKGGAALRQVTVAPNEGESRRATVQAVRTGASKAAAARAAGVTPARVDRWVKDAAPAARLQQAAQAYQKAKADVAAAQQTLTEANARLASAHAARKSQGRDAVDAGMTMAEVGRILGVAPATLSRWAAKP